jgi:hypothetical protein
MDEKLKTLMAWTEVVRIKAGDLANAMDALDEAQKDFDAAVAATKSSAPEGSYWHRQAEMGSY